MVAFIERESEICPQRYFNHDGNSGDALFYKTKDESLGDAKIYGPKMKCLTNLEHYNTFGNYDTASGDNLMVIFEMCDPKKSSIPCKSPEEIKQWMYYKYIVVFTNEKLFVSHKFGEESINEFA